MTKPSNLSSIETATGLSWSEWTTWLGRHRADELPHPEIAALVADFLTGRTESPGWWAQNITVAYEQHIGRREPGQVRDGSYETSVTKTIAGSKDDVFALWCEAYDHAEQFDGKPISNVRTSLTPVRSYWRADFNDGSRLEVAIEERQPAKSMIAVSHTKLGSSKIKEAWLTYWKEILQKL